MSKMRIGLGEDIHLLVPGRKLILGGVHIPYELGLLGHSDADVVYHAVSDAMLGALALGDIGHFFPTDDPRYDDADSALILGEVYAKIKEKGYRVENLDITIACEKPHLAKHLPAMRQNIAKILEIAVDDVGIQAMTNEGCDAVGQGKAIRANAVCLLERN